jgi:hypothetical protein
MESEVKKSIKKLSKNEYFNLVFKNLILRKNLSNEEKSFILSCSIIFLKFYEKDKRCRTYLEIAYFIILKYSLNYGDYKPLYDFSVNIGFFPTANFILNNNLLITETYEDAIIDTSINTFKDSNNKYIQTLEQHNQSNSFLSNDSKKKCYIAPTSYGKSAIIVDYIKKHENLNRIGIIVPTKSLLNQTYKLIKNNILDRKILIHNEMYGGEEKFIAIFTQERALKFLEKNGVSPFDLLIIDEAHNIFESDSRNILLSRLIKKNQKLNFNHEIIYLSPLIEDKNNLKLFDKDVISSNLIKFNIKEPTYFEYSLSGDVFIYNQFLNKFYEIDNVSTKFNYILKHSLNKNFLFENNPKKIEKLSLELAENFEKIKSEEINELKRILIKETHKDFYLVKLLDYGIIYLHGKMPNLIKDYLELKFDELKDLKFIIANTVILEGINLPIDNMFIHNTNNLSSKKIVNLIGRVNRLNLIFSENSKDLNKLSPNIHFINTREYKDHNSKLKELNNRVFKDIIKNPTLPEKNTKPKSSDDVIKKNEDFLINDYEDTFKKTKKYFIENSLHNYYKNLDLAVNTYLNNYSKLNLKTNFNTLKILDFIHYLFIENSTENIIDDEFLRLRREPARKYYAYYMDITSRLLLPDAIDKTLEHFQLKSQSEDPFLYVGDTYGETNYPNKYGKLGRDVYINLFSREHTFLVNIAIVKLKMEENFTNFTVNKFVDALFDLKIISEAEREICLYGSNNKSEIDLFKFGLPKKVIKQLIDDKQIKNIIFNKFGNLTYNVEFNSYLNSLDEFKKFELQKYI